MGDILVMLFQRQFVEYLLGVGTNVVYVGFRVNTAPKGACYLGQMIFFDGLNVFGIFLIKRINCFWQRSFLILANTENHFGMIDIRLIR